MAMSLCPYVSMFLYGYTLIPLYPYMVIWLYGYMVMSYKVEWCGLKGNGLVTD